MDRSAHGDVKTTVWVPRSLLKRAKLQAAAEGRSLRLLVSDALRVYLERTERGTR